MKIVFISDTHSYHRQLALPEGDIIIHAGDLTKQGAEAEVLDFLKWFEQVNFRHKIFIAGNHDFFFEKTSAATIEQLLPPSIIYLNDSGVTIEGIKIWGSPIQPWFFDWAFNRQRGADINRHWELIPTDTDILVTHGPPFGILDQTSRGEAVGCTDLLRKIKNTQIKMHAFGHIHEAYGISLVDGVQYINASVVNLRYQMTNKPIVLSFHQEE